MDVPRARAMVPGKLVEAVLPHATTQAPRAAASLFPIGIDGALMEKEMFN
jgi:hypothetical protein